MNCGTGMGLEVPCVYRIQSRINRLELMIKDGAVSSIDSAQRPQLRADNFTNYCIS